MSVSLGITRWLALALLVAWSSGCRPRSGEDHAREHEHDPHHGEDHAQRHAGADGPPGPVASRPGEDHDHDHEHEHEHDHEEGGPSGASFKPGEGVLVTEETRRILDLNVAEVVERPVPVRIPFTLQIFGEEHRHGINPKDHAGCDVHGSGFLAADRAREVRVGHAVRVMPSTNLTLAGVVLGVQKALALGEWEVVAGVSNAVGRLWPGEFVAASIAVERPDPVPAMPREAVLRTAEGTYAYVVNGEAYRRTAITVGAESEAWAEITAGLRAGERVVVRPVQTLWLIELRATKGGGHSH